jgi:hypothetical protein
MDSASAVEKKIGKDWDTLDPKRKQMLVDYQFNLKGGISKFPEFTKAVIANDLDKMREEYKRHYRPDMDTGKKNRTKGGVLEIRPDKQTTKYKELTRRNEKFFNKYLQGGKAMPEDQEVIDGGEDVMTLAGNDSEWMTIPDHQKRARDREKDIQDELQKQMHPDAPKDDAFANVDTEEYFANSEKSKKALEMDYRRFIAKGMKLIHGKDTRENILKSLQIDNPIEAVSNIVTAVINRVDTAIRNSGQRTPDEVKAVAANNLLGQIFEIGEASGTVKLDDDEKELAYSLSIQKYLDLEVKAGRIDPQALAEENGRSISEMNEDQRVQVNDQMERINRTAMAAEDKYGFKMPGMLGGIS